MRLRFAWDAAEPPHAGLLVSDAQIRTIRMDFGRVDDSQHSENLSGALLVPAALPFSSKRKTESSKDWKASNNLYTRESKSAFLQYFFAAQMRGQAETPAPIKSGKPIRMADAIPKSSPLWGRKFKPRSRLIEAQYRK